MFYLYSILYISESLGEVSGGYIRLTGDCQPLTHAAGWQSDLGDNLVQLGSLNSYYANHNNTGKVIDSWQNNNYWWWPLDFGRAGDGQAPRKKVGVGLSYIYIRLSTHSKPLKSPSSIYTTHSCTQLHDNQGGTKNMGVGVSKRLWKKYQKHCKPKCNKKGWQLSENVVMNI